MDSRKPLTAGEIEELKEEIRTMPHKEFFGENLQPLVDDHSRLLSLLTPPPDAAVREAVELAEALAEISAAGLGAVAEGLRLHISDLTRRLAGAEAQLASREQELLDTLNRLVDERGTLRGKAESAEARATIAEQEACEALAGAHAEQEMSRHWKEEAEHQKARVGELEFYRADALKEMRQQLELLSAYHVEGVTARIGSVLARVRELEATIDAMAEAHAHDDMALTAAYLSGAHAGKKQAEAERDALREALIQIDHHASQNRVWAGVDGWKYAGLSNVAQKKIHGITQAALATEVKP